MFDVLLAAILLRALVVTARGRYLPALAAALAGAALFALLAAAGWYGRLADALGPRGALMLALFGPSVLPGPTEKVPLSGLVSAHPVSAHLALAAILGAGFAAAWRYAARVSPLADESVRRKDVGLALLAPALLVALQAAPLALGPLLSDPF